MSEKQPVVDAQIIWDLDDDPDGNIQHIAEHGLTVEEVEDVLLSPLSTSTISRETNRPITFGWTSTGRYIGVIWEVVNKDPRMVRVRTAYDAPPAAGKGKRR